MRTTVLLTDSACDLSPELEKEYGIDILPFHITVDGVGYTERVDFDCEQYYDMLTKCKEIPKTAQITSFRYLEKFEEYAENGVKNVICVTINSGGSNTHQSALMARDEFANEHPESDMHIYIVDSHSYSMVYAFDVHTQFSQKERTHQRSGGLCRRAAGVKAHHYDY